MSNFVGNKPNPLSMLIKGAQKVFGKTQKTTGTGAINQVNISKNLTKLRKIKDEGFKSVDDQTKGTNVSNQKKSEIKKSFSGKVSNIINPVKKAKGGRVGLKRGTGLRRPSNVEKIKKAFGPKQKPQSRMTRKKKFPDLTGDGKVTFADILKGRGVINGKKKKKVI